MKTLKNDLKKIKFSNGLIPAVIQDIRNKEVLMVAYMNRDSLQLSLETGETHFWSRSRKKIWRKGETSGHIQKIRTIFVDCDQDTLLIEVEQVKAACHTGKRSCFFQKLGGGLVKKGKGVASPPGVHGGSAPSVPALEALYQTIRERKRRPSRESYTSSLLEGGLDLILKKIGEEAGEFIISAKNGGKREIVHETADLLYHLLVALGYCGISMKRIEGELRRRSSQSGLAEKRSRNKQPRSSSA
ncbi:MAG: bifunctional phosphoribosyl-AMP cyclohydrolase/phosphoribosyl-ATP diphosphatase HisIE [Nitrospiria bacterium]